MIKAFIIIIFVLLLALIISIFIFNSKNKIHKTPLKSITNKQRVSICIIMTATILLTTLPMGITPTFNGANGERNQYEKTANALLEGKTYIDNDDVNPKLLEMKNPYDYMERQRLGIDFEHDNALYKGHYYMYFGVVPVITTFIPFKLITGKNLTTYHATQIFTALFIIGLFLLFKKLSEVFFDDISFGIYISLATAFSIMSVWYAVSAPALYCTAITSALCFQVFSFFFFIKAVYETESENKAILQAFLGALCGALTFGCRPTIALSNILIIPLLIHFLKERKFSFKLFFKLFFAASPFVIVGAGLMYYNYIRFDSPFEFGTSYMLTEGDQTNLSMALTADNIIKVIKGFYYLFVKIVIKPFNPVLFGAFITFPILFLSLLILKKKVFINAKNSKTIGMLIALAVTIFVTTVFEVLFSSFLLPRYRMDFYWLLGIIAFIVIGFSYKAAANKEKFSYIILSLSAFTIAVSILLFAYPFDKNFTEYYINDFQNLLKF